jgi:DNA (cytosine-5)-methyltransferase 1
MSLRVAGLFTGELSDRGYNWAYRTIDTRAFGLPQRRKRVYLLASRTENPCVLFDDASPPPDTDPRSDRSRLMPPGVACGFSWTEGERGLGWCVDGVPTIRGGSGVGIPSPPAIVMPDGLVGTPDIRDCERLQGFPSGWTDLVSSSKNRKARWKQVGNAVSVPIAEWVGQSLLHINPWSGARRAKQDRWPTAAYQVGEVVHEAPDVTAWPVLYPYQHLADFLYHPIKPLSR